jgi:hypothetical protein
MFDEEIVTSAGADVMITIFADFRQFSAKNCGFQTNVTIQILRKLAVFCSKNADFLGRKYFFKIITSVPDRGFGEMKISAQMFFFHTENCAHSK